MSSSCSSSYRKKTQTFFLTSALKLFQVLVPSPLLINILLREHPHSTCNVLNFWPDSVSEVHEHPWTLRIQNGDIHQNLLSVAVAASKVCSLFWWINLHPQLNLILPSSSRDLGLCAFSSLISTHGNVTCNQRQCVQFHSIFHLTASASAAMLSRMLWPVVSVQVRISLLAKYFCWISWL